MFLRSLSAAFQSCFSNGSELGSAIFLLRVAILIQWVLICLSNDVQKSGHLARFLCVSAGLPQLLHPEFDHLA